MANGDAAAAAYGWLPVLSSDDIKQGYDRINQLADVLAGGAWALSPISLNATLWNTLTDPMGGTTAGSLVGGVRKRGGVLDVSFRMKYSGATITAALGDVPDTTVCTFAAGFRPSAPRLLMVGQSANGQARIGTDGVLQIVAWDSSAQIVSGMVLQIDGQVAL